MARTKFQLTGPAIQRGGNTVRQLSGLDFVYIEAHNVKEDGSPYSDMDRETYVHTEAEGGSGYYVLTSSLSKIAKSFQVGDRVKLVSNGRSGFARGMVGQTGTVSRVFSSGSIEIDELTSSYDTSRKVTQTGYAEDLALVASAAPVGVPKLTKTDFPEGRLVFVGPDPKTVGGGYVDERFDSSVGRIGATRTYGENVVVHKLDGTDYNVIGPEHLTLLPEGVDLAAKVARPELAFEDAIRKAAEHRDAVGGKDSTEALIELAKLLVEVAK